MPQNPCCKLQDAHREHQGPAFPTHNEVSQLAHTKAGKAVQASRASLVDSIAHPSLAASKSTAILSAFRILTVAGQQLNGSAR